VDLELLAAPVQVEAVVLVVAVVADIPLTVVRETHHQQARPKETTVVMVLTILDPATLLVVAAGPAQSGQTQLAQLAAMAAQVQHLQLRERL
jgi:hypothetical protein